MAKKSVPVRSQIADLVNEMKGSSIKDQLQELVDLMNERRSEASYITKLNPKTGKLDKTDASRHTRSLSFYDNSIKKLIDMLYPTLHSFDTLKKITAEDSDLDPSVKQQLRMDFLNDGHFLNGLISDMDPSDQRQLRLALLPNVEGKLGDGTLQEAPIDTVTGDDNYKSNDARRLENIKKAAIAAEKEQQIIDDLSNKAAQAREKLEKAIADKKLAESDTAQSRAGLSSSRFNANTADTGISEGLRPYFTVSSIKNPDPLQVGVRSYTLKSDVKNAIAQLALSDLLGSDEFSNVKVSALRKALEDRIKRYTDEAEAIPFEHIKENLGNPHSDDELATAKKAVDDEKDEKEKAVKQAIYQRMLDRNAEIATNDRNINQNKLNQLAYQKAWAEVRNARNELDNLDPYGNLAKQEERFNKLESEYHPEYITNEDKLRNLLSFANNGDPNDPVLSQLIQAYDIPFNKHRSYLLQGDIDQARREAIETGKAVREASAAATPNEEGIGADVNIIQTPFGDDKIFVKNTSKANGTRMGGMAVGVIGKDGKSHIYHADLNIPNGSRREILKPYGGNIDRALHDPRFVAKYVQIDNIHNGIGVSIDPKTGKKIYGPSFEAKDLKGLGSTIVNTISGMPATLFRPENRYRSDRYNKYNESMDDFIKYGNYNPTTEQGYKGLYDYSYDDLVDFFAQRNAEAAGKAEVDDLTRKRAKTFVDGLIKQHKVDVVKDDYTDPKTGKVYTKGTLLPSEWNLVDPFYVNKRAWVEKRDAGDVANHFEQLKNHLQKRYMNLVDGIFETKQLANDTSLSQEQRDKYSQKLKDLMDAKERFDASYKLEFDDDGNVKSFVQTFKPGKDMNAINKTSKYNKSSGGLPSAVTIFGKQDSLTDVESDLEAAKEIKADKAKKLAEATAQLELFMQHYNAANKETKKLLNSTKKQLTKNRNLADKDTREATSKVAKLENKHKSLSGQIGEFYQGKAKANEAYQKKDDDNNGLTVNNNDALMEELTKGSGSIWG